MDREGENALINASVRRGEGLEGEERGRVGDSRKTEA